MTRPISTFAVLLAALTAAPGPLAPRAQAGARLCHSERAIIRLVNEVRSHYGLPRLRASHSLSRAADRHSHDMLRRDFFAHPSSDGTPFDRRVRRFARASAVGETLAALAQRRGGAATVVRMWMGSPPHRAVLLGSGFGRIGVARHWGTLGGSWRSVVTADFGSRR